MCGIIGILNFGTVTKEQEKARRETSIFLATELLQQTQTRGKDATGVVNLHENGDWYGLKEGIDAIEFVSKWGGTDKDFAGFAKIWRKKRTNHKVFLGHCRKSSVGSTWNNSNNHPIRVGDVIGIHNGTLENHETIFDRIKSKRDGDVDSEAIIRLLHAYSENGTNPFTVEMIREVAIRLQGSYAVLAISGNNPFQVASFRDQRPIDIALLRQTKQVILTSDNKFVKSALFRMNKEVKLYDNKDYPFTTEKDVDFKIMSNDIIAIWDLTREIEENTTIDDLYEKGDIPRTGRKWRKEKYSSASSDSVATHNANAKKQFGYAGNYNKHVTANNKKVADDDKKNKAGGTSLETESEKSSHNRSGGMVWDKDLDRFKPTTIQIENANRMGNVAIDVDDGTVNAIAVEVDKPLDQEAGKKRRELSEIHNVLVGSLVLEDGDEDSQDSTLTDPVKIEEVLENDEDIIDIDASNIETINEEAIRVEVDADSLAMDPEALAAANAASNQLEKFENIHDVLTMTRIEDEETFKQLSTHAFANRLQKLAYRLGFYDGWTKKPVETIEVNKEDTEKELEKKRRFDSNFRVLKTMSNVVLKIIGRASPQVETNIMDEEITEALRRGEQLDSETLDQIFSKGDMERNLPLRKLKSIVKAKEK